LPSGEVFFLVGDSDAVGDKPHKRRRISQPEGDPD
jgi:hypothetical protein